MPVSGLFLMGSIATVLLGMFQAFLSQTVAVRMSVDTPQLAIARLHYVFWGVGIFIVGALVHLPDEDGPTEHRTASKVGFWLMFLGFNLAFFPTTLRRSPAFLSDALLLLSPAVGPEVTVGVVMFAVGTVLCLWNRALVIRSTWV